MSEEAFSLSSEDCDHLYINEMGYCEECGEKMEVCSNTFKNEVDYSEFHSKTSVGVSYNDVNSLSIPEEIKKRTLLLLSEKGSSCSRNLIHNQEIFMAVTIVYFKAIAIGEEFDPLLPYDQALLAKELGLKVKHLTQISDFLAGIRECTLPICEEPPFVIIPPTAYIPRDCQKNNIVKYSDKITEFAKRVISYDKMGYTLQDNPKNMSLAFIKLYLEIIEGRPIPRFCWTNKVSENMLRQKMETIMEIINENNLLQEMRKTFRNK